MTKEELEEIYLDFITTEFIRNATFPLVDCFGNSHYDVNTSVLQPVYYSVKRIHQRGVGWVFNQGGKEFQERFSDTVKENPKFCCKDEKRVAKWVQKMVLKHRNDFLEQFWKKINH